MSTPPHTPPEGEQSDAAPTDDGRRRMASVEADHQRGQGHLNDHLANERTLLAWSRTGIAIIALGFVVARFGLLIRELSDIHAHAALPSGAASIFGIALTLFGAALVALSLLRYLRIRRGIDEGAPRSSADLDIALAAGLILTGLILAIYLALSS